MPKRAVTSLSDEKNKLRPSRSIENTQPAESAPPMSTDNILRLQRTIGNHATRQLIQQSSTTDVQRLGLPDFLRRSNSSQTSSNPSQKSNSSQNLTKIAKGNLTLNGAPTSTVESEGGADQVSAVLATTSDASGFMSEAPQGGTADDVGHAGAAFGTMSAALGSSASFVGMVSNIIKAKKADNSFDRTFAILDAIGMGAKTGTTTLQATSMLGGMVADGIANNGNKTAATVSSGFGGVTEALGSLTGVIQMFMSGIYIVRDILTMIRKGSSMTKSEGKGLAFDIGNNAIDAAKGFLTTARSTMNAVKGFLDVFGVASTFADAMPIVGSAINTLVQFLDMVVQTMEIVRQAIRIHKARILKAQIAFFHSKDSLATNSKSAEHLSMLKKLAEINKKRVYRAIRPLTAASVSFVADMASVTASVLNIIGVATSPAYGAGVGIMATGYALNVGAGVAKMGAGLSSPIASAVRNIKQKARDDAATSTKGGFKDKFYNLFGVNRAKSTQEKHKAYVATTKALFDHLGSLPAYDEDKQDVQSQYNEAYIMLKATGVDKQALFLLTDVSAQAQMVMAALKKRE